MSSNKCPLCDSLDTSTKDREGRKVCKVCGYIYQESSLVNEVAFTPNTGNGASVKGVFVPSASSGSGSAYLSTQTLNEGINKITSICDSLPRIPEETISFARRAYQIAVRARFTRGRTIEIVSAAAVYVAIRRQKDTGYLLDDIAQHVTCGIYELAATALRLAEALQQPLPVIDPTLYLRRFTEALNFGRQAPLVHETAIKLIRRLDRDWIQTGRKPSGLCASAIMIAARVHNIQISMDKVLEISRVCASTINKRLKEIAQTELANSSIDELRLNPSKIETDSHELPPSVKSKISNDLDEIIQSFEPSKSGLLKDTFDDEELKDTDSMILSNEEKDKKGALFYGMYKNKINEPPKKPKQKRPRKEKKSNQADNNELLMNQQEIHISNDESIDGDDDFEDVED